jgi:hypothetical protein
MAAPSSGLGQDITTPLRKNAAVHHSKNCAMMSQRVKSGEDDRGDAAADVCFAPESGQIADRLGMSA